MRPLRKLRTLILAALLTVPAFAHHSFSMFDLKNRKTLQGTVTQFKWSNPHVFIEIDVPQDSGEVQHYSIETASPSWLSRYGWKHNSIKPGDKVSLVMFPLRDGKSGGALQQVTLADGTVCRGGIDADENGKATDTVVIGCHKP
jgi:hypothetical protein